MAQAYFAQITPGLEDVLKSELKTFQVRKLKVLPGAVSFMGTRKHLYRVLQWSRCAHRVYWTLGTWSAPQQEAIYQKALRIAWDQILPLQCTLALKSTVVHSQLSNTQIRDLVFHAICKKHQHAHIKQVSWTSQPHHNQNQIQRVLIYYEQGKLTIRLDATGGLMHKRGWRVSDGAAPLRATLIASIFRLANWHPFIPLIDPMCGSGTWSIEALQHIVSCPPRLWTLYPCQQWQNFEKELWVTESMFEPSSHLLPHDTTAQIFTSDINQSMVQLTSKHIENNIKHCKLTSQNISSQNIQVTNGDLYCNVCISCADINFIFNQLPPCQNPGYIVLNPPYQIRVKSSWNLFAWLGRFMMDPNWEKWKVIIVLPQGDSERLLQKYKGECLAKFKHGGLMVYVLLFTNHGYLP